MNDKTERNKVEAIRIDIASARERIDVIGRFLNARAEARRPIAHMTPTGLLGPEDGRPADVFILHNANEARGLLTHFVGYLTSETLTDQPQRWRPSMLHAIEVDPMEFIAIHRPTLFGFELRMAD